MLSVSLSRNFIYNFLISLIVLFLLYLAFSVLKSITFTVHDADVREACSLEAPERGHCPPSCFLMYLGWDQDEVCVRKS